ncbi:MAG TPA: nitrate reductase [Verrucomicrobiae bacterium]|nr:nitrate reductase [Verrucomicrobiae bacterium]
MVAKKIERPLRPLRPLREDRENSLLRQWNGPLTQDLTLHPADFGLGKVPARLRPDATTRSVCGFCSTGCSLDVHLQSGVAVNLTPTADYPVNLGMACPKGWEALTCLSAPDRGTTPLLRNPKTGKLESTDWDEAMQVFTVKFKAIMDQHGPESVALLSTGQICTEEMAFVGALWKFGMGALHCDSNTRQCMATSHVAYKQSFGFDAPPYTYADFEESDCLVFIGSNLCIAHPIMWQRVMRNKKNPDIIVVDPRRTETAMNATQHLALAPKSDLTLLYGIANLLIQNNWINREFIDQSTTGFADFASFVREFTPDKVAAETGLTVGQLFRFAETIGTRKAVSFWWTMGVNQSHESTRTAQAIINLALMTGNIGRPGTGANSITGQCNAMGSRLFANATSLFGGRDFLNAEHRAEVSRRLHLAPQKIPARNSLAYDQILDGVADGKIKGLWVIATNTAHSWIDSGRANGALDKLEFLVVQDMFTTTDTARKAHLFLPAAGWGEKEGTFINSERRFGHIKKVSRAPGQAMSDFNIFRLIAEYWGCSEMFSQWTSPQAAFQILKRLSAGRPCDFTGIEDYRHLDAEGGIQWPFKARQVQVSSPSPLNGERAGVRGESVVRQADASMSPNERSHPSPSIPLPVEGREKFAGDASGIARERRLFADGKFFTADGKAKFIFDAPRPVAETTTDEFPFVLLTGRGTSAQWHTNTRTGKSAVLRTLYPANPYVEINPSDAARLGLTANAQVALVSRRARVACTVFIAPTVQPGQAFIPMHYGVTNQLTRAEFDPHSRQPSYKHCAVRLEKI